MKAKKKDWEKAIQRLNDRRQFNGHNDDNILCETSVRNYKSHLEKIGVGDSILDVGCGSQFVRHCIDSNVKYFGMDAFPIVPDTIESSIESNQLESDSIDTVIAFAVLDNSRDFFLACSEMKRIAKNNIGILTGINIEVDQYHTLNLQLSDFDKAFSDLECYHKEEITPKVYLLCYRKSAL